MTARFPIVLASMALLSSCGGEQPTEVVLVIDSDLSIPDELDAIEIVASGMSDSSQTVNANLIGGSAPSLPLTLTFYPADGMAGDFSVRVRGTIAGVEVARRDVTSAFRSGQTRMLRVILAERCQTITCSGGETCDETGCRPVFVDPADLPEWPGSPPVLDGPACTPRDAELCNGYDDDCDEMIDEGIDITVDTRNCGACGRACPSGESCAAGLCDGERATAVAAGGLHTCAIRQNGRVACWGSNLYGQLGDGTYFDRNRPGEVVGVEQATQVSAGIAHGCAVTATGAALCWGDNTHGELGDGTVISRPVAAPVNLPGVEQISAGVFHTCAVTTEGSVACWGDNVDGQLGNGTVEASSTPVTILAAAANVSSGFRHTCAASMDGTVSCWGDNARGQLGDGTMDAHLVPTPVTGLPEVAAVVAGRSHTCALLTSGAVACWGENARGQLGDGTNMAHLAPAIVSGVTTAAGIDTGTASSSVCVTTAMGLSCWGANGSGQLATGDTMGAMSPVTAMGLMAPPMSVSVGGATGQTGHMCVVQVGGAVLCVGDNGFGQLGDESDTSSSIFVTSDLRR